MSEAAEKKEEYLMFKGKPLVRSGNTIYYGSMKDKYVIMMQIQETKKDAAGMEIAGKITIQLLSTDLDVRARDRIIKKSEKEGLYNAMDLAGIWLERALKEDEKS